MLKGPWAPGASSVGQVFLVGFGSAISFFDHTHSPATEEVRLLIPLGAHTTHAAMMQQDETACKAADLFSLGHVLTFLLRVISTLAKQIQGLPTRVTFSACIVPASMLIWCRKSNICEWAAW